MQRAKHFIESENMKNSSKSITKRQKLGGKMGWWPHQFTCSKTCGTVYFKYVHFTGCKFLPQKKVKFISQRIKVHERRWLVKLCPIRSNYFHGFEGNNCQFCLWLAGFVQRQTENQRVPGGSVSPGLRERRGPVSGRRWPEGGAGSKGPQTVVS